MLLRPLAAAVVSLAVLAAFSAPVLAQQSMPAPSGALTPAQRAEVIGLIKQELEQDPSILRAAIAALQADDQASQASAQSKAIAAANQSLFHDAADPSMGNPHGSVQLVEFYDTRCPYCREMRPEFAALVERDPNVRVIFKDIPILGQNSVIEARALLAAQRQGHYVAMQSALMSQDAPPTEANLRAIASRLGMDPDRLIRDMKDPAISSRLSANTALAQTLGVTGTPAIVVGDQLVPGAVSLEDLQKLVAQARAG
ncbi:DsbA family protein [Acidisoma sp. 7E03]